MIGRNKGVQTSREDEASAFMLKAVNKHCGCNCFIAGCTQWQRATFTTRLTAAPCIELAEKTKISKNFTNTVAMVKHTNEIRGQRRGCREVNSF